jgi:hypothetical protein
MDLDLDPYQNVMDPQHWIGHLLLRCVKIPTSSCTGSDADPAERSAHPGLRGRGQGAVQGLW